MTAPNPVTAERRGAVLVLTMADRAGRNRITAPMQAGIAAGLASAAENTTVRAVVLAGLPDVFCAGAAMDRMLGPRAQRTEAVSALLRLFSDCPVPVVAAAQGHALGGGLLLALTCDVTVLSDVSRYAANFHQFGFTPVLGATHLVPAAFGTSLGAEMLWTGRSYRGRELAERGAGVVVTGHERVLADAVRIAGRIAQAPRDVLTRTKKLLSGRHRAAEAAAAAEAADHEETITGPEARRRIRALHGQRLAAALDEQER
ncbi:putative enoyl-CoA hydratase/isomerase [Actinoplanes missouriensis 431]|uniref:Putative enoyl-CoA hydratase/isomerase n=1 Tax=Actinoplanes missouriensis (strain ATCC 14538 / DSM 43046 / CBS 188.64 / JCM 3121 / NBRC 102363 / NCIMB 12654 / NRRL B-3342 / UNCC 431) TaxID=512565 RepID=I0HB69_ACTM4|nr:polyketide synthase [Actinoplanes missouriensis]BAL90256.1 putative enoyl-CoA hydratase/isomerase [Actinoplanes missouriensis 431]